MDQAARGKKALSESKYEEAIAAYTAALKLSPTSPDYLTQRATAYHRAHQYAEALEDAERAVIQAQKRAKKEAILEAQFRRACALYQLGRYGNAQFVLDIVKRLKSDHKMSDAWLLKAKAALAKLEAGDEKALVTVKETPEVSGGEGAVAEDSQTPVNGVGEDEKTSESTAGKTSAPSAPQQTPADKIRHEWYQNNDNVYFTLLAKGVPKDKAQIDVQEHSLSITFPLTTGSSYDFTLEPLFAAVVPEKCITRIMSTKIEVILVKAAQGQKWSALESSQPAPTESSDSATAGATNNGDVQPAAVNAAPVYPTSSKTGPKDWDKITSAQLKSTNKDGKTSIEDDDDYEGGDEANHFFKKLFKGASPDAQRAMMKSYTESNGTALSTDWADVSKKTVETLPPDGMTAKKWGE